MQGIVGTSLGGSCITSSLLNYKIMQDYEGHQIVEAQSSSCLWLKYAIHLESHRCSGVVSNQLEQLRVQLTSTITKTSSVKNCGQTELFRFNSLYMVYQRQVIFFKTIQASLRIPQYILLAVKVSSNSVYNGLFLVFSNSLGCSYYAGIVCCIIGRFMELA